jgi:DNA-binding Lrp family transcriptional regulator
MVDLDRINKKILRELESDGRMSNTDLAERVGLSPSACLRRVQELERQDLITGYKALVNPAARGVGVTVYVSVGLTEHGKGKLESFQKAIARVQEVRECHVVTGSFEFLLRVEVADLEAYKNVHTEVLADIPNVASIVSNIVLDSPKDLRA